MRKKRACILLWILFAVLLAARILVQMSYWILLAAESCGLSFVLLRESGMPSGKYVRLSWLFALLSTCAYLGYQRDPWILLYGLRAGIPTLLSSLAVFSVMEKHEEYELVSGKGKHPVLTSILIAVAAGLFLAGINLLLAGEEIRFAFDPWYLFLSLNPAIYEEMACRSVFMAFCAGYSDEEMDLFEKFTMYFMMCVPHTVIHGYPLTETIILCVLFGLPFTLMQRKRDIMTAMISHGIVDALRFLLIGM
ncbi:MAG: hypothetical protein IKE21_02875 [Erysipelotrichaceae bacterium]|nr:hypothetical protein [Erysipelotrichaceae bacterium]